MSNFNNDSSQRDSRKRWTPKPKRGSQRLQDESTRLVLKKQRPRKVTRRKSTISRSNVLKFIVSCLEMELYSHMLYWADREKDMRLLVKICGNE
ncbi:hypothetical protein HNY73_008640 [Argiope bruennichi]|uniref:Uncharacterized protein n=1 Tax=Argiope bruennichi TaxID=94029 RepID=A0A8T0FCE2_ARGBR|nr:hypothetical protein HNY73_008640 [Argiope bruennichi]